MEQKRFLMSQRDIRDTKVISKTVEGAMTTGEAARVLKLSRRQVFRRKARVTASGPRGLIHGNKGRSPATTTPEELMQKG